MSFCAQSSCKIVSLNKIYAKIILYRMHRKLAPGGACRDMKHLWVIEVEMGCSSLPPFLAPWPPKMRSESMLKLYRSQLRYFSR